MAGPSCHPPPTALWVMCHRESIAIARFEGEPKMSSSCSMVLICVSAFGTSHNVVHLRLCIRGRGTVLSATRRVQNLSSLIL